MLRQRLLLPLLAFFLTVSAHFELQYPEPRGDDEDKSTAGPCGGFDTPSAERTPVSLTSIAVSAKMGHDESAFSILLGLGNDPSSWTISLLPTIRQEGLGDFCLDSVPIPSDLGIQDGSNGTLQVMTNGDPSGGLYTCADITFTSSSVASYSDCKNGTGVMASFFSGEAGSRPANESTPEGESQIGPSGTATDGGASRSPTGSAATSTQTGGAPSLTAGWTVLGAALVGLGSLL